MNNLRNICPLWEKQTNCPGITMFIFFFLFFKIQICSTVPSFDKLVRGNQTIISQEAWELLDWSIDRTFTLKTVHNSKVFVLAFQCKVVWRQESSSLFSLNVGLCNVQRDGMIYLPKHHAPHRIGLCKTQNNRVTFLLEEH